MKPQKLRFDPVGFGGQFGYYTDVETGLCLLTNRYYDAGVGRFLTRDPISYDGGINLYGFCGNNPVNESDPSGLAGGIIVGNPTADPANPGVVRVTEQLGKSISRFLFQRAATSLIRAAIFNPVTLGGVMFFGAQTRVADDSTGPGSPYGRQQRDRWLKKRAKDLLNGENIEVGSIRDADDLLNAALPNAQQSPGAGPTDPDASPDFSQFKGTNPNGMYHKDYLVDPQTGRIYGHDANNAHGGDKHINIKLPSGRKVFIKITPRVPFR